MERTCEVLHAEGAQAVLIYRQSDRSPVDLALPANELLILCPQEPTFGLVYLFVQLLWCPQHHESKGVHRGEYAPHQDSSA